MIRCFEESGLKYYGYGSRFNTPTGSGAKEDSDWDLQVVCTDDEWNRLESKIQNELGVGGRWTCERIPWKKGQEKQPVISNFSWLTRELRNKNAINVRRIMNPETDLLRKDEKGRWVPSDFTKIV